MLAVLLLLAAATPPVEFPERIDLAKSTFVIELTCHFQTSRFRFEGRSRVVIEDLGDDGSVAETHAFERQGLHGIVLSEVLADSFARDPGQVAGQVFYDTGDDEPLRLDVVTATTACRATLDFATPGFRKRTRYETEEAIPGRVHEMLKTIHFQADTGVPNDPFVD